MASAVKKNEVPFTPDPPMINVRKINYPEYPASGPEYPDNPEYPSPGPETPAPPDTEQIWRSLSLI